MGVCWIGQEVEDTGPRYYITTSDTKAQPSKLMQLHQIQNTTGLVWEIIWWVEKVKAPQSCVRFPTGTKEL